MSAGMSCDLQAVFQPMFESSAGAFSLSVRCTTKKCQLEVDGDLVDFGSHVLGQTISRTITLINRGLWAPASPWSPPGGPRCSHSPESSHGPPPSPPPSTTENRRQKQQSKQNTQHGVTRVGILA
ncbi:hypothetical protein CRUP_013056 [Coryphaenoides rupestris]|nr:hypothetical protein CRUP_013056 [Coryphaenoides rupestris]